MEIIKYSKQELLEISRILKKYRTLRKNIGKKSSQVLFYELSGDSKLVVEYFPTIKSEDMNPIVENIYKNIFSINIDKTKIVYKENNNLKGGIRLFFGDDMLDISYESVVNNLNKIL